MTDDPISTPGAEPTFDPRLAAFRIVEDVLQRRQTLELAETARVPPSAPTRDRAFCRWLAYGCLRHLGDVDRLVKRYLTKKPSGRGRAVETVVRIGITQLLFTDVPPYAAADTTVELCRAARLGGFTKLVNAIMRRTVEDLAKQGARRTDAAPSAPAWLLDSWRTAYGVPRCRSIAAAHLDEPPLDLVVADATQAEYWAEALGGTVLFDDVIRIAADGRVEDLAGYDTGAWWIQDAAATLPVRLLGDVGGKRIADLCAAPGGKTLQLAARKALVTAVDRSDKRLKRLGKNLDRTNLTATVERADASAWKPAVPFDSVLLDAPCSATGTIRRHPDIPWIRTPEDVAKLVTLQDRLLRHAVDLVKPGGLIVYCTCSLQPEEGEQRIEAMLTDGLPVERLPLQSGELPAPLREVDAVTTTGDLRTLPDMLAAHGGIDGFFAARLVKTR